MLRKLMPGVKHSEKEIIKWRSNEIFRIEAFSDAVFAFAVTLLIIALEVPENFDELLIRMKGFFAFGICFLLLFQVWYAQCTFFRRYGLHDITTVGLNGGLLFVVLYYVYPLKFLFTILTTGAERVEHGHKVMAIENEQLPQLMVVYGIGYVAIFLLFALMYRHALRQREQLVLTENEVFETKTQIYRNLLMALIGVISMLIALMGPRYAGWAGVFYAAIGPVLSILHARRGKMYRLRFETPPVK